MFQFPSSILFVGVYYVVGHRPLRPLDNGGCPVLQTFDVSRTLSRRSVLDVGRHPLTSVRCYWTVPSSTSLVWCRNEVRGTDTEGSRFGSVFGLLCLRVTTPGIPVGRSYLVPFPTSRSVLPLYTVLVVYIKSRNTCLK